MHTGASYRYIPAPMLLHVQDLQGALAARDSEVTLLRQQLSQLTSDFKFNLKLLEERDLELERLEAVNSGLKETAAAKELVCGLSLTSCALRNWPLQSSRLLPRIGQTRIRWALWAHPKDIYRIAGWPVPRFDFTHASTSSPASGSSRDQAAAVREGHSAAGKGSTPCGAGGETAAGRGAL